MFSHKQARSYQEVCQLRFLIFVYVTFEGSLVSQKQRRQYHQSRTPFKERNPSQRLIIEEDDESDRTQTPQKELAAPSSDDFRSNKIREYWKWARSRWNKK